MNRSQEDVARSMITAWAIGAPAYSPPGAMPIKDKLAQFLRDKPNADILSHYAHPFGYSVKVYDGASVIYEKSGRVEDAARLLDVFTAEAQAAIIQFGPDKLASFAPTKA